MKTKRSSASISPARCAELSVQSNRISQITFIPSFPRSRRLRRRLQLQLRLSGRRREAFRPALPLAARRRTTARPQWQFCTPRAKEEWKSMFFDWEDAAAAYEDPVDLRCDEKLEDILGPEIHNPFLQGETELGRQFSRRPPRPGLCRKTV